MVTLLRFLILIFPMTLHAQFTYVLEQDISVQDLSGNALALPWAGGLNAAHYNTLDLNGDSNDDLVIFDRMGDKILTFINQDNTYRYAPEFEGFFPDEITNWLLLRDFNCDGRKDIFTGHILGIKVYTNVTSPGENPSWEEFFFYSGSPGSKSEVLLTKGFSGKINLQLQFDDLPSFNDADGDGDLDIFNVRFTGQGTVEYHQNFSKERYGTCDSLDFERTTQTWGGFTECDCGEFAFNNDVCATIGGRTKHAGGKSLLMLDIDNNSTLDVLFSEAECTNLYALPNEGTTEKPTIQSSFQFPGTSPVNFQIYPAAFYEDVDFDGRRDLISIPNIFSKPAEIFTADLSRSNWLYKNTGTDASPVFTYVTNSFLQDQMIDVGDNAIPAFADYDGDGDQDMFVSHNNTQATGATVWMYENVGTASSPSFSLRDRDAFAFSSQDFYNLKIQFSDLNHDSKTDLVFTATSFINGQTRLYYLPNRVSTGLDFDIQAMVQTDITIVSSENISAVEVNGDGLQDLLIGKSNGTLQYWRNLGQPTPKFSLEDDAYLGLTPNIFSQNVAVTEADLDADGNLDLALGDQQGIITIVSNFRDADTVNDAFSEIIFNPLTQAYHTKNLGGRIWPTTANLFNSNKASIIVGNILGGIRVLRHDDGQSLPKDPAIIIYPNPVDKESELVTVQIDRPATLQIFNGLGQAVTLPVQVPGNEYYQFKVPYIPDGVYYLRFTTQGSSVGKRLVVH
jgi:hypothetical protein